MALSKLNNDSFGDTAVHGRRNLVINGAMQVAQRGTSSSTNNYQSVDRWKMYGSGPTTTKSQQTLTSGSPYDEGFRYFARQANTSVSSSTTAYVYFAQWVEAQNIAGSGWNYTSTSSSVTLSFWARSSLAGTYYAGLTTNDGTEYIRHKAFTLAADTWTKVTFTTAGNSNLTFNNDNGAGLFVEIAAHYGTAYTGGEEVDANDWYTRGGNLDAYYPNFAQNWGNTASATFDVTGVQLEVGDKATPFEHRSFGEELSLCQRYAYSIQATGNPLGLSGATISGGSRGFFGFGNAHNSANPVTWLNMPVPMRVVPSLTVSNNTHFDFDRGWASLASSTSTIIQTLRSSSKAIAVICNVGSGLNNGDAGSLSSNNSAAYMIFDAEL